MIAKETYSSGLSGKGSLISETELVLAQFLVNDSSDQVRQLVVDENLLLKRTAATRRTVWEKIYERYISGRPKSQAISIARIVHSNLPETARHLVMFYEMAKSTPLVYDLTTDGLYSLYYDGRSVVNKSDIHDWLDKTAKNGHDEITNWSPQTKDRVASHYLTIARDFGLLTGKNQKYFTRVYLPLNTFVYVLYRLKDEGLNTKAIVTSADFKLFLQDQRDVFFLLEEATRAGYITFQQAGDIYGLTFHYQNLSEIINELIGEI